MTSDPSGTARSLLAQWLRDHGPVAVAVSGGVDSLTVGLAAHRANPGATQIFHAVSAAVPQAATALVKDIARREGWDLQIVDAGETSDPQYIKNPINRCYFCKQHLYAAIRSRSDLTIVSGTNADDLGDFRPGLKAALETAVRHPLAELGIRKPQVRALCRDLGYTDIAEQPAQPCLASRVQTGIPVLSSTLAFIENVERSVRAMTGPGDIRCRVMPDRTVLQLGPETREALSDDDITRLQEICAREATAASMPAFAGIEIYRQGSSFVRL